MTAIGADPEALLDLSRRFRSLGVQLEASRNELDRHLRNSEWQGADAERFRRTWSLHHRGNLLRSAELCRVSTANLVRQVDEQHRASDGSGSGSGISGSTGNGGASGAGDGAAGAAGVGSGSTGRVDTPATAGAGSPGGSSASRPRIPDAIMTVEAGASVTVASVLLGLTHDITIESFPDGTSLVTFTSRARGGAKGSAGASINLGTQRALGASASAEASLGGVLRRSYTVDSSDVWKLIAAVELQDAAEGVISSTPLAAGKTAVGAAASIGGWLLRKVPAPARRLLDTVGPGLFRPPPTSTEKLVQFVASSDASLESVPIVGPSANLGAAFTIRAGRIADASGAASVFEAEGSIAAEMRARFLGERDWHVGGSDGSGPPTVRIEIPDATDDGRPRGPMILTSTVTTGDSVRQSTSSIDLSKVLGMDVAETTRLVFQRLSENDLGGAFNELTRLRVPDSAIVTTVATFTGNSYSGGVGGEAGGGLSLGVDFDGGIGRLVRTN
ncbi:MAG: hypothetical protein WBA45_02335 [Microthrixaceae bacterium]